ncbi:MAG: sporulation protein YunB [Lachnospiraceae bacterium]|nr:sporulation protein YunB [Lachnospiraceae bacterium]
MRNRQIDVKSRLMRYKCRHCRRYRKLFVHRGFFFKLKVAVLSLFIFAFSWFLFYENRLAPFMEEFTLVKGEQMMSDYFSQTVTEKLTEMNLSYDDLIVTNYSKNGEIQSVSTDVVAVNNLKNAVTLDISDKLKDCCDLEIDFPLGNAFGSEFLSGTGPKITFNSTVTGGVMSEFRTEIETGGINQTVHRLYIDIKGDLVVVTGGSQKAMELDVSVLLGETVIVGNVPSVDLSPKAETQS